MGRLVLIESAVGTGRSEQRRTNFEGQKGGGIAFFLKISWVPLKQNQYTNKSALEIDWQTR